MNHTAPMRDDLRPASIPRLVLMAVGGVALVSGAASAIGAITNSKQFGFSHLVAIAFAVSLSTGALFWVLIHHLTDAGWSVVVRRPLEHLALGIVPIALLFIPVVLTVRQIYVWADAGHLTGTGPLQEAVAKKAAYLNLPFFLGRSMIYFAIWSWMALRMWRWSVYQDTAVDFSLTRRQRWHSPTGVIALGVTTTFAAIDWIMSLDPHWTSTMFGVYFWAGALVSSLAALTLILIGLRAAGYLHHTVTPEHLHDLGKLLFGFVIFWAYIAFSQYFLIWYANVSEETPWYLHRLQGSWSGLAMALPVCHFVVPFLVLLPRASKRNPWLLGGAAAWLLVWHYLDLYWQIQPVMHPEGVSPSWMDATTLVTIVGVLALVVLGGLRSVSLVPLRDPRLSESIAHHQA